MELVLLVFDITSSFPKSEQFGLVSQIRRSAVAIPSNIAEGYGRRSKKEFSQFISIAYGSAMELETQLILSRRLKLAQEKEFEKAENLLQEVLKMLNSIISKLKLSA